LARNEVWLSCIVGVMTGAVSQRNSVLTALYEREHGPMLRVACLLVGSRAVAEEVVHEAFATVGERWTQLDNPGGYLRATVVNGCRMVLRRRATEMRHAPTAVGDGTYEAPAELVELRSALAALPDRHRAVIVLRYFLDLPDNEIAEIIGCREATVRSIVYRVLRTLRKELT
jgi:RNA polymerase sigma factor (sigma-70 family)